MYRYGKRRLPACAPARDAVGGHDDFFTLVNGRFAQALSAVIWGDEDAPRFLPFGQARQPLSGLSAPFEIGDKVVQLVVEDYIGQGDRDVVPRRNGQERLGDTFSNFGFLILSGHWGV